uniref:NADH dehydrogenase [ubiquinone] 1 beta subcomplex subunit 4 n=1 Tax=Pavo cristatus TaxID=9049 RepID=A0A8C9FY35_PAVCR
MASKPTRTAAEEYRPNRYVSLPAELDPATYDTSPEKRRAEAERLAIRARLKRQYLLQLNNPKPPAVIEDPALLRWDYARTHNVYPTFRPTPKTSFLGAVFGIGPILFWMAVFKTERDYREKLTQEDKWRLGFSAPLHSNKTHKDQTYCGSKAAGRCCWQPPIVGGI